MKQIHQGTLIALLLATLVVLTGCETSDQADRGQPPATDDEDASYAGPETEVMIGYDGRSVTVELDVPTGGWRFELDNEERANGGVRLFATLEAPPPGLMVTQAIEQKRITWEGAEPVERAKVFIRMARRGESLADSPYRLAGQSE